MSKVFSISQDKINQITNQYDCNNGNIHPDGNVSAIIGAVDEYIHTKISKQLLRDNLPLVLENHEKGFYHLNDLSHLAYRPINCCIINPFDIIDNGFKSTNNVKSAPPKHLNSFLGVLYQTMVGLTQHQSGGIACGLFSWVVAYFADKDNLTRDQIKQDIQQFIFSLNQCDSSRMGSSMFSSINIDLDYHVWMENINGYSLIGLNETNKMVVKIIAEVCADGDSRGSVMLFPNLVINITKDSVLSDYPEIFNLVTKFYSPYFNIVDAYGDTYKTVMGCRSALSSNFTGDPIIDCLGTGNLIYSTLNLPKTALSYKENKEKDYNKYLKTLFDQLKEYSLFRLNHIKKLSAEGLFGFHDQFYSIENGSIVIGILGLSETIEILYEDTLNTESGLSKAKELLEYCKSIIDDYKEETGLRFALFSPPSENACHRLAKIIDNQYGRSKTHTRGSASNTFLTNGVNLPVACDILLTDRIQIETELSKYCTAGNICSLHMGETYSDPTAIMSLTNHIKNIGELPFFAFSGVYSICDDCDTKYNTATDTCYNCGGQTTTFDRITGYIVPLKRWNKGKLGEQKERYRYK
jgi:ribonucleoside-triphosphate reductase